MSSTNIRFQIHVFWRRRYYSSYNIILIEKKRYINITHTEGSRIRKLYLLSESLAAIASHIGARAYDGKEMVGGKSCVRDRRWSCWHFAPRRVVCARKFIVLYLDRRYSYSRATIIDAELSRRGGGWEGIKEEIVVRFS